MLPALLIVRESPRTPVLRNTIVPVGLTLTVPSPESVAVPLPVLCEFVWALLRRYGRRAGEIAAAIMTLADSADVDLDRPAVEAGLGILEAGGDFADGVLAFEGRRLGGNIFVSFDRDAIALIAAAGGNVQLLSE